MPDEQRIVKKLCERFDFLRDQDTIFVQRQKRIFTKPLAREEFEQVLKFLHDEMGFYKASHVIGTDDGEDLGFIYLLFNEDNIIVALKEKASKSDPRINSMSEIYPSLLLHERELVDLFGADVQGLPKGPSYPLPDGWPKGNYPMRKDWNPEYFDRNTMTYHPPGACIEKDGEENERR